MSGTPSLGQYIKLQAAVLQQLPRPDEFTPEVLDGWILNQASLARLLRQTLVPPHAPLRSWDPEPNATEEIDRKKEVDRLLRSGLLLGKDYSAIIKVAEDRLTATLELFRAHKQMPAKTINLRSHGDIVWLWHWLSGDKRHESEAQARKAMRQLREMLDFPRHVCFGREELDYGGFLVDGELCWNCYRK